MFLEPLLSFLLRGRPEISRDSDGLVFLEGKVRHSRARPIEMGILDPANHPARIHLGADSPQTRTDLGDVLVSFNQVATGAADLLEKPLALSQQRRILKGLNVQMTGDATALDLGSS